MIGHSLIKSVSILIMDDDIHVVSALKAQLENAGHKIVVARTVTDFHRYLSLQQFELAFIELKTVGSIPFELIKYALKNAPYTPIIAMTSIGSEHNAVTAMKEGAVDYISKPFDTDDMLSKVQKVLALEVDRREKTAKQVNLLAQVQRSTEEINQLKIELASLQNYKGNPIIRSIEFSEDAYQAGISILSYFSTVVKQKYPKSNVKVRIEQEGRTVRLVIETPDGEKERIEKTLEEYGLVVVGQMRPQSLLPDEVDVIQLQHKLEMSRMELTHTRQLLSLKDESQKQDIARLEDKVNLLMEHISDGLRREVQSKEILFRIIDSYSVDGLAKEAIVNLSGYLEKRVVESDKEVILGLLGVIKEQNKPAFESIKSFMLASLSGATGNWSNCGVGPS
jgi:DNA-binding response OmpR family regulator